MLNWIKSLFTNKPKEIKVYKRLSNRCWVCGELSRMYCPGSHTVEQKKIMINHYKSLGYTHGIPSIEDTNY